MSELRQAAAARAVVVAHSSDLHVDDGYTEYFHGGDGAAGLRCVLATARAAGADLVLLAGDIFEHNRLPATLIDRAARLLAEAGMPVVILPGNHDPLTPDSPYLHDRIGGIANVHVLGAGARPSSLFPTLGLEIWGHAHRDYGDMDPLRAPPPRRTPLQIAVAHGHYEPSPDRSTHRRPSWLLGDDEIDATAVDYVALGHWNRAVAVGRGRIPAFYSGSPEIAGTMNLVTLIAGEKAAVLRTPLRWPSSIG